MDRKEFIRTIGLGTGAIVFATCLGGCGSDSEDDDPVPVNPGTGKVDFTFDVTSDASLQNNGWTIRNRVIIARSGSNYLAYQSSCTHQGNPLTFNSANTTFPCSQQGPDHGSVFDSNGVRIAGPAADNLKKYSTQLSGNNLRVFEP